MSTVFAKLTICSSYLRCWKWKVTRDTLDWKQKSVKRCDIVWNLPSVVVDSDTKNRKIQKIRPIKTKESKTILVISMATLPTVVVFSGAVNKKARRQKIYRKLKFNDFSRQSIFPWKKINRLDSQCLHQVIETRYLTNQRAYFLRTIL